MDKLHEEIDAVLDESLVEYVKASDFRVYQTKIDSIRNAQQKKLAGLDKELAKEFVTALRYRAAIDLFRGTPRVPSIVRSASVVPDFNIASPNAESVVEGLRKFLNYSQVPDDNDNNYIIPPSITDLAAKEDWARDKIEDAKRFVRGQQVLQVPDGAEINLDFKNFVLDYWENVEPKFREAIIEIMQEVFADVRAPGSPLPDPEGRPLTPGTGDASLAPADVNILPSELSAPATNDVYVRLVNYIKENQTQVDKTTSEYLEAHGQVIERLRQEYKNNNNQVTRSYGYGGPAARPPSERSWNKFVNVLKKLDEIVNKAASDYTLQVASTGVAPTATVARTSPTVLPEGKLQKIVIDLDEVKSNKLNESFLAMFGGWVEKILDSMFGGYVLPAQIKGSKKDVESFAKAIGGEKSYIDAVRRYGLDHPTTYKSQAKLNNAIKNFERDTGITWPFR